MNQTNSRPRLLADIGGTNARFALWMNGALCALHEYKCNEYPELALAAKAFLAGYGAPYPQVREAAIAIAAPITGDRLAMTNHNWQISVSELRAQMQWDRLIVINDFTALAMSLRHLPKHELEQHGGGEPQANRAIGLIGPGTGLGVSGLIPINDVWMPIQGEGGHVTMSACNDREAAILEALRRRYNHVSAERVICGSGLVLLYETLCELDGIAKQTLQPKDVADRALNDSDKHCVEALNMFCAMFGTLASNLALTLGALGGVYIGGGIIPRLGSFFANSAFRERFDFKGRYTQYVAPIPVYLIRSANPAFVGLAQTFDSPSPRIEVKA
jgi:glucokinase